MKWLPVMVRIQATYSWEYVHCLATVREIARHHIERNEAQVFFGLRLVPVGLIMCLTRRSIDLTITSHQNPPFFCGVCRRVVVNLAEKVL